jgi:hypothetical protein
MKRGLLEVAAVENAIDIAAPTKEIFDVIVDVRNEPQWNPKCSERR